MKMIRYLALLILLIQTAPAVGIEYKSVEFHGFASQGYLKSNHNNFLVESEAGSFKFYELGLNAGYEIEPKLRLGGQVLLRTMGETNKDYLSLDWGFAEYRWRDWLGVRAGKVRIANGLYNEIRDLDMLRPNVLLPQSTYDESSRETALAISGGGLFGYVPLASWGDLAYQVAYGKFTIPDNGTTVQRFASYNILLNSIEVESTLAWSVAWEPPLAGLVLGVNQTRTEMVADGGLAVDSLFPPPGALANDPASVVSRPLTVSNISVGYTLGELILASEYLLFHQQQTITIESSLNPVDSVMETYLDADGIYLSGVYRVNEWLQLASFYSILWADKQDRDNPEKYLKDACMTVRFDYDRHWNFKLEGHSLRGTALCLDSDNPQGLVDEWRLFAAKVTYAF